MIDFTQVKEVVIPEGEAKLIAQLASNISFDDSFDNSFQTGEKVILWLKPKLRAVIFHTDGTNSVYIVDNGTDSIGINVEYSYDGKTWIEWTNKSLSNALTIGGSVGDLYLRGTNPNGWSKSLSDWHRFTFTSNSTDDSIDITGNIMWLLDYTLDLLTIPNNSCFRCIFDHQDGGNPGSTNTIHSVDENFLPATELTEYCYSSMFCWQRNLMSAPKLPARVMKPNCYHNMFTGAAFTVAPDLKSTSLATSCYTAMFLNCSNLISAPDLPATVVPDNAYIYMFTNCTSLVNPPIIGATSIGAKSMEDMFMADDYIVHAPDLLASTLYNRSYYRMFNNCDRLNYIRCLATSISASNCLASWLEYVASSGTFVKHPNATWPSGKSGIPSGWTVINDGDLNQVPSRGGLLMAPSHLSSVIVLTASEGHYLTQVDNSIPDLDRWITKEIYLGNTDSEENYKEITEEEGNAILAILQQAFENTEID